MEGWGLPSPGGVSLEIGLQLQLKGHRRGPYPCRAYCEGEAIAVEIFDQEMIPEDDVVSWLDKIGYERFDISKYRS